MDYEKIQRISSKLKKEAPNIMKEISKKFNYEIPEHYEIIIEIFPERYYVTGSCTCIPHVEDIEKDKTRLVFLKSSSNIITLIPQVWLDIFIKNGLSENESYIILEKALQNTLCHEIIHLLHIHNCIVLDSIEKTDIFNNDILEKLTEEGESRLDFMAEDLCIKDLMPFITGYYNNDPIQNLISEIGMYNHLYYKRDISERDIREIIDSVFDDIKTILRK